MGPYGSNGGERHTGVFPVVVRRRIVLDDPLMNVSAVTGQRSRKPYSRPEVAMASLVWRDAVTMPFGKDAFRATTLQAGSTMAQTPRVAVAPSCHCPYVVATVAP